MKLDGQVWITRLVDLKVKSCYISNGDIYHANKLDQLMLILRAEFANTD